MILKISFIIHTILSCVINKTKHQGKVAVTATDQKIMKYSALITYSLLMFVPLLIPAAHAATGGFAQMANTGADQASAIKDSFIIGCYAVGVFCVGLGCFNLFKKGKEGENSQVTASKILIPLLGGAALGGIGYIMQASAESAGIDLTN